MQESQVLLFCATALPIILTPGPDIIYIITRGIGQGRSSALLSMLGVCLGYLVHTLLAVLGLSALLHTSEILFNAIRYAGAAYLIYLGVHALRSGQQLRTAETAPSSGRNFVFTGMATSVMNPKGILFFLSFLPQFVIPSDGQVPMQVFCLGLTFTFLCMAAYGTIAYFSGAFSNRLTTNPKTANVLRWATGSVMVALGMRLALPQHR
jgi:threonine/homoserine/homoserine lactone efflux protein